MTDRPNAFNTVGVDWTSRSLCAAQLHESKGVPVLDRFFELPIEEDHQAGESVKPLYMSQEGRALRRSLDRNLIVSSLPADEVIVRQLEIKLKKLAAIDEVLLFQAEPLLPYSLENALVDRAVFSDTAEGTLITLFATKQDYIKAHLQLLNQWEIEPEVVSASAAALSAYSAVFAPNEQPQFVLHIAFTHTICALVKEGKLIAAQTCRIGLGNLFEKSPGQKIHELDFATLPRDHELYQKIETFHLEVTRILYALTKQVKGQDVVQILATGEGSTLVNLPEILCKTIAKPIIRPEPTPTFNATVAQLQKFAISIGNALTALPHYTRQVNFRQGEFVYPHPWKRYKLPIALYLGLSFLIAGAFYFAGQAYLAYKEDEIRRQYSELLMFLNQPYTTFENEYTSKMAGKKEIVPGPATPIASLSRDEIADRLRYLGKEIASSPDIYPLLPNVPTVSDVLAWLGTHPHVIALDPETGAAKPLLQIENFTYTLVKRPEMNKKQEKYQVKVEIEFSSPTAKFAREFHDALIAPNQIVDPKGEVKWTTNRGLYRASFYLKDRTVYPSSPQP